MSVQSNPMSMEYRKLGPFQVSAVGFGCMGLSHGYGACPSKEEGIRLIRKAYECGCNFFDTAEAYGPYANEDLVGEALKPIRDKVIISTKVHPFTFPGQEHLTQKISREGIRLALENSLKRLQTDHVELYYLHRVPSSLNLAEVATWFGELIKEGKIKTWGISEATAEQISAAHAVTPLTAVQSEYSIMERKYEKEVIPLCKELGITFVAYAPMAGGFLIGKYNSSTQYHGDDIRRVITRYIPENVEKHHCTPAQISLAYLLRLENVVPIPGMRSDERIKENFGAAAVKLPKEEIDAHARTGQARHLRKQNRRGYLQTPHNGYELICENQRSFSIFYNILYLYTYVFSYNLFIIHI